MELTEGINDIFEETKKLEELLAVDNVEAITPDDNDIISLGEESVIEDCLNDTDGSLSSVNLAFFDEDPSKPAKARRKKTMEKRKEERMSFRHLVDDETASDNEDDEDLSSMSSFDSDFFREFTNKETESTIQAPNTFPKMKRIYSEIEKDIITASSNRGDNSSNLKPNSGNVLSRFLILHHVFNEKSKSLEELRRNYEEDKSETKKDFEISSTGKHKNVSKLDRRKRIMLSSLFDRKEKKSESVKEFQNMKITNDVIEDVETPSTSKNTNIPKKRIGGLKRIISPKSDEEEKSESREEWNISDRIGVPSSKNLNVAKKKVVRRKIRGKRQEVANNAHIYSFFSSMADLVSTLPYSTTLTAKARVTKMLEEMVERLEKNSGSSPLKGHEISEEDLKIIKLRLSRLPYIY